MYVIKINFTCFTFPSKVAPSQFKIAHVTCLVSVGASDLLAPRPWLRGLVFFLKELGWNPDSTIPDGYQKQDPESQFPHL